MKFLISIGSYERIVFGCDVDISTGRKVTVKDSFAIPAHISSVRSVASCPKFLVSGSADETIKIFDLRKRKDIGCVVEHNGSVNSLEFCGNSHLLTGSEDGKLALFRTSDWECLHVFHHKSPISSVAMHPSGKLALSVSKSDRSLRVWNLVTGKLGGKSKTVKPIEKVIWSPTGLSYALLNENLVMIYDASSTKAPKAQFTFTSRALCCRFSDEETLLVAGEGSLLRVCSLDGTERTVDLGQSPRIKDMSIVRSEQIDVLVTVASEGSIRLWDLKGICSDSEQIEPLAEHRIHGLRPICLTVCLQ